MAGKGSRHRIELSRLEIAGVVVSAAAALFIVFLLGVYAGRGMVERGLGGEDVARLPVPPAGDEAPAAPRLTFYDTLGGGGDAGDTAAAAPAAPAATDGGASAGAATAPREGRAAAPSEPPPPARQAAPPAPARTAAPPPPARAERTAQAQVAVVIARETPALPAPGTDAWSVQVTATRDPRTAENMKRQLLARGYDAYVKQIRRQGETFYRVRVGHYASMESAHEAVVRLRREPGVPEAFVASD